ncbi:unnamed protein product [[Candida] boidinii]|nr:unnamed protein product [[Candida] boidinii]
MSFQENFWSSDYTTGFSVLVNLVQNGLVQYNDFIEFLNKRKEFESEFNLNILKTHEKAKKNLLTDRNFNDSSIKIFINDLNIENNSRNLFINDLQSLVLNPLLKFNINYKNYLNIEIKKFNSLINDLNIQELNHKNWNQLYFKKSREYESNNQDELISNLQKYDSYIDDLKLNIIKNEPKLFKINSKNNKFEINQENMFKLLYNMIKLISIEVEDSSDYDNNNNNKSTNDNSNNENIFMKLINSSSENLTNHNQNFNPKFKYHYITNGNEIFQFLLNYNIDELINSNNNENKSFEKSIELLESIGNILLQNGYISPLSNDIKNKPFANIKNWKYEFTKKSFIITDLDSTLIVDNNFSDKLINNYNNKLTNNLNQINNFFIKQDFSNPKNFIKRNKQLINFSNFKSFNYLKKIKERCEFEYINSIDKLDGSKSLVEKFLFEFYYNLNLLEFKKLKLMKNSFKIFIDLIYLNNNYKDYNLTNFKNNDVEINNLKRENLFIVLSNLKNSAELINPILDLKSLVDNFKTNIYLPKIIRFEPYKGYKSIQIFGNKIENLLNLERMKTVPTILHKLIIHLDSLINELNYDNTNDSNNNEDKFWVYHNLVDYNTVFKIRREVNNLLRNFK